MGYRADLGEKRKRLQGAKKGRKPKLVGRFGKLIRELIQRDWSPEQIRGRLKLEGKLLVSQTQEA
jgi:IS30 family transposase